jgi:putative transposase
VRSWLAGVGAKIFYIEPGRPWEGKLRDEPPNGEIFSSLKQAKALIGQWRHHYNIARLHSSLGY